MRKDRNLREWFAIVAFVAGFGVSTGFAADPQSPCSIKTIARLNAYLEEPGQAVIRHFSRDPEIAKLFASDAGVSTKMSIREHTLQTFEILDRSIAQGALTNIHVPSEVRLESLMRATLALHDIGKPQAIAAGSKALQRKFTLPILTRELHKAGFNSKEIAIARALVDSDFLGQLLQGGISKQKALTHVSKYATRAGLSQKDFFRLKSVYFTADAGSYPELRATDFQEVDQRLILTNPLYKELESWIEGGF